MAGASLEEIDEEEEETASVDSGAEPAVKEGCFQIVGTLKDPENPKPEFAQEVVKVIHFIRQVKILHKMIFITSLF